MEWISKPTGERYGEFIGMIWEKIDRIITALHIENAGKVVFPTSLFAVFVYVAPYVRSLWQYCLIHSSY